MAMLRALLHKLLQGLDDAFDALRFQMLQVAVRSGINLPVKIATYRGFGRTDRIFLQGRVLIRKSIRNRPLQNAWHQLLDTYRRLDSSEIPHARLHIYIGDHCFETLTDKEGYFTLSEDIHPPLDTQVAHWVPVRVELIETPWGPHPAKARTKILIPPPEARFGVITDIDDTIIHTGVTSPLKWEVLYNTLFKSPARRKVFDEVAAFFRALRQGPDGEGFNPVFYVSNSPRNFHSMVKKYLRIHKLPKGPLLLRDIGIPYKLHARTISHKADAILRILETYPKLPFVLIGDSGEKDPYLYHEIALKLPGRIRAIFIRDVQHARRRSKLQPLLEQADTPPIRLFDSYTQAASLAAMEGLLNLHLFRQLQSEGKP